MANRRPFARSLLSHQIVNASYYCPERGARRTSLEVVCAGREQCRGDYAMTRRAFPWLAIELVLQGEGRLTLDGRTARLNPGTVFSYGPGVAYQIATDAKRPMLKYFVDFSGTEARRLMAGIPLRPGELRHALYPLELQEILDRLIAEGNRHSPLSEAIALNYLRLFLQKLAEGAEHRSQAGSSPALEAFLRAKTLFDQHYETLDTAERAARKLRLTPERLCRVFRRFANTTPYQYLLRLKINRAVDLLLGTSLQAKEVAYRLGFSDPFHFSRVFKRLQGSSPDNFRHLRADSPSRRR